MSLVGLSLRVSLLACFGLLFGVGKGCVFLASSAARTMSCGNQPCRNASGGADFDRRALRRLLSSASFKSGHSTTGASPPIRQVTSCSSHGAQSLYETGGIARRLFRRRILPGIQFKTSVISVCAVKFGPPKGEQDQNMAFPIRRIAVLSRHEQF